MISAKKANVKLIKDVVKSEVDNVKQLMNDLLKKKMDFYQAQADSQKATFNVPPTTKFDFGTFYQQLQQSLEDLATEIITSASTETVRKLRAILGDMKSKFKVMTSGEVKTVLDMLYEFIVYTGLRNVQSKSSLTFDKNIYSAKNTKDFDKKSKEVRNLVQQILFKFVHENAIAYLGQDLYPPNFREAMAEYEFEDFAKMVIERLQNEEKNRDSLVNQTNRKKAEALEKVTKEAKLRKRYKNDYSDYISAIIHEQVLYERAMDLRDIVHKLGGEDKVRLVLIGWLKRRKYMNLGYDAIAYKVDHQLSDEQVLSDTFAMAEEAKRKGIPLSSYQDYADGPAQHFSNTQPDDNADGNANTNTNTNATPAPKKKINIAITNAPQKPIIANKGFSVPPTRMSDWLRPGSNEVKKKLVLNTNK